MRTTLTIDPEVAERLRQEIRRSGKGMKAVVNEALRRGFGLGAKLTPPPPFEVTPHAFGVQAGVDLDRINQLVDELDAFEAATKLRR